MTAPSHPALIAGLRPVERAGEDPATRRVLRHDEAGAALRDLAATWTLPEAADAWVAGLWSAPFGWRAALTGTALGRVLPVHDAHPYSAASSVCRVCGHQPDQVHDTAEERWLRHTEGVPVDGDVADHVLALEDLAGHPRPVPTEYDRWALRAVLTILRTLPAGTRPSKARDALKRAALLPTTKPFAYGSLLEELALVGVVATAERPGMVEQWTTYAERDERPSVRVEVQAPLAWWDASHGLREDVVEQVFGHLDTSPVDLDGPRPTPVPDRKETATVAIPALLRAPKPGAGRLPAHVGTGDAEAGDVWALRLADDRWVTLYVHGEALTSPRRYVLVEYLAGVHPAFPDAADVATTVQPRRDGRSPFRVHSLEKLPRARRIARGVPAPGASEPLPDSSPAGTAEYVRQMVDWFFPSA
ncbi:hypothetical protein [Cellulomonas triticagri]|uniref:Uncharacterized protein n=1 Tax=Cellulomonas triticagri TaxID=2483352 RepID=A0A3M2JP97_9CELL|nr:hypothetical protein [Cellulomonas triticagri]RMI12515.1 hypothetical protein EBM89_08370 [Cellulomonas triticagri]